MYFLVAKWVSAGKLTTTSIQAKKVEIEYLFQACFGLSKLKDLQMSRMQNKPVIYLIEKNIEGDLLVCFSS